MESHNSNLVVIIIKKYRTTTLTHNFYRKTIDQLKYQNIKLEIVKK